MISSHDELLALLERTIRTQRLLDPDDTVIVAVSGGADSTALLDMLTRLPGFNLRLVAAHLNHCLRGSDSDADEEFCRGLAAVYAIPFESRRVDVKALAEAERSNLEDAGRRARIAFFDELREKYGAATVAVAQHADDQVETFLMRLLRGSGMTGLSGIASRNERGYVRPLLGLSRSQLVSYLNERRLGWRDDDSNSDTAFTRNRIRHQLLPILESYNPAIRTSLAATAELLRGDEALLAEMTEQAFGGACVIENGTVVCGVKKLNALHPALRRRVLRRAFKQLSGTLEGVSQRHIDAICNLLDSSRPNSQLTLPQRVTAVREYERILFTQTSGSLAKAQNNSLPPGEGGLGWGGGCHNLSESHLHPPPTPLPSREGEAVAETFSRASGEACNGDILDLTISAAGHYPLPDGASLTIAPAEAAADCSTLPDNTLCISLDKLPFPWRVRTFCPGDRIIPFGMSGRKKVKNIFIDRKIPLSGRRKIPLLFCGDELIWIAGICRSESCRIDTFSSVTLQVTWQA